MRHFTKTLTEAKKVFKQRTGIDYSLGGERPKGVTIFYIQKKLRTPTRKYFVGTQAERFEY
jgi:hypothetical protein